MSDEVLANIETSTGKCSSTVGEWGGQAWRALLNPGRTGAISCQLFYTRIWGISNCIKYGFLILVQGCSHPVREEGGGPTGLLAGVNSSILGVNDESHCCRHTLKNLVGCFPSSLPCGGWRCQAALAEQGKRVGGMGGCMCVFKMYACVTCVYVCALKSGATSHSSTHLRLFLGSGGSSAANIASSNTFFRPFCGHKHTNTQAQWGGQANAHRSNQTGGGKNNQGGVGV